MDPEDVLIDPTATDPPAPTTTPPHQGGAVAQPPAGRSPIQLTDAEYKALLADRNRRVQLEAEKRASQEQADSEKLKLMAEKGQFEEALRQHQTRADEALKAAHAKAEEAEKRYLDRERSLAVNDATAGAVFVNDFAARQARTYLEAKFEVVVDPVSGAPQVVDKVTRRPAADVAREWLAGPEAALFLAPKGKGGGPAQPGNAQTDAGAAGHAADPSDLSFEQRTMRAWQEMKRSQAANGWQLGVVQQAKLRNTAKS